MSGAVSDFGAGPHSRWYQAQVSLVGFGAICLTLDCQPRRSTAPTCGGWRSSVPADSSSHGFPLTYRTGRGHAPGRSSNLLAIVAFASIAVAASSLGRVLDETPGWDLADWLDHWG